MEIIDQIKKLERESKEAQAYKQKYEQLKEQFEKFAIEVQGIIQIRTQTPRRTKKERTLEKAIQLLTDKLKEGKEIRTQDMKDALKETGERPHTGNIQVIRTALIKKQGVQIRKERQNIILFWIETGTNKEQEQKELLKMMPKKLSFMR